MKKTVSTFIVGMMLVQNVAYAQNQPSGPNVGIAAVAGSGSGSVYAKDGKYDISKLSTDATKLAENLMDKAGVRQDADRALVMSTVSRFTEQLNDLSNLKVRFDNLSVKSQREYLNFDDLYAVVQEFNKKASFLSNELKLKAKLDTKTFPSSQNIQVGNLQTSGPQNYGSSIDLSQITNETQGLLDAIIKDVNAITFPNVNVVKRDLKTGEVKTSTQFPGGITGNVLQPKLPKMLVLDGDEVSEMRKQINRLLTPHADTQSLLQLQVDKLVTQTQTFGKMFGADEWMRFDIAGTGNYEKQRMEALQLITDAFYQRSYARKKFARRMGAIQPAAYDKKAFGIEEIFGLDVMKTVVNSMKRQAAINNDEVMQAFVNAANWVEVMDKKTTPIFQSREDILKNPEKALDYSSQETNLLVRANSLFTLLKGQARASEVLKIVMRLILADVREEMMLIQNKREELAAYHDARYRSTPELKKANNKKMCQTDWTLSPVPYALDADGKEGACLALGVKYKPEQPQSIGTDLPTIAANLLGQIRDVEGARKITAAQFQAQIDASLQAAKSDTQKAQEADQEKGLFE